MTTTIEEDPALITKPPVVVPAAAPADRDPAAIAAALGLPAPETGLEPPPEGDEGTWSILGASWTAETIRTDAWEYTNRRTQELAMGMVGMLPPEARANVYRRFETNNGTWDSFADEVVREAAKDAAGSADGAARWASYPQTREALQARIDAERRADLDEAQAILDQPGGGFAEFVGTAARAMTDKASLAMMPLGVGGGAIRTILGEVALGMVGEVPTVIRENEVATELDLAKPDAISRILMGGALAGGLSAGILGIVKGIGLIRARTAATEAATPGGVDPIETEVEVDAAEAAMTGRETVTEVITPKGPLPGADDLPYNEAAVLRSIIGVESGGKADAKNPASSATGLGQFIGSTWLAMINKYRPDVATGKTSNEILALRNDPTLSAEMTAMYARESAATLTANGLTVEPGHIYLGHFMGPGGMVKTLKAPLDTPITALMSPKEIAANRGIRFGGKSFADFTAGDLRRWAQYKMRRAYDPDASRDMPDFSGGTTRGYTRDGQVMAGDDFRIDVEYEVVDISALTRASGDFQPRDRSRMNSDAWIADTAARLDPAQLMPSPTADRGAPIVGPDGMIESGNGRFSAIERAYQYNPDRTDAYRSAIEGAGFAVPEGVTRPILIARRTSDLSREDRVRLTVAAQDSGVAVMTPTEIARASSRAMTTPVLGRLDPSQPLASDANAGFVRAALAGLPRSARNAMFDGTGLLNRNGERQLREAVFARAWSDPDIIEMFTEADQGDLKSLMQALDMAAPNWAALKADIEAGRVAPEFDISGHVLDAMRLIASARKLASRQGMAIGKAVAELLDEVDLIEGAVAPLTAAMVRKFWTGGRAAPAEDVAAFLSRYADDARKAGASGGMFDAPTPRDVLAVIDKPTFGSLPEDLGPVRGFARPGQQAPQVADSVGYDTGAASPEAEAADQAVRDELLAPDRPSDPLAALIESGADAAQIAADPDVAAFINRAMAIPLTTDLPQFGTNPFWATREYRAKGEILLGKAAATEHLYQASRTLAWREDGLTPDVEIANDRRAVILLGAHASGKSTVANPIARSMRAAIIDADEAKKIIPEYDGGIGANAVHEESSILADEVVVRALEEGTNIVLPKVGGSPEKMAKQVADLQEFGYRVDVILVDVQPVEAWRRMIGRFRATGRLIPPAVMEKGIAGAPKTYDALKLEGTANAFAKIDNSPGLGQPRRIVEDDAGIVPADLGRNGRDRNADLGRGNGSPARQEGQPGQVGPSSEPADGPTRPAADLEAAAMLADARASIGDDWTIDLPDGTTVSAREFLDDLDADAQLDAAVRACAITPGGAA